MRHLCLQCVSGTCQRFFAPKLTALGFTRPLLALAKPDGFAPGLAPPPCTEARSFAWSFLLSVIWFFPFIRAAAHWGTCPMERLSPDHRIGRGPTQSPLMEFALKKNNPLEACNSKGRLFLRATLPGARREWFAERDGGHLSAVHRCSSSINASWRLHPSLNVPK